MEKAEKEIFFSQHIISCEKSIKHLLWQKMDVYDEHAAEEILQNTMVKAWQHLDQLKHPEKAKGWVSQIARNELRMYYRSQNRKRNISPLSFETFDHDDDVTYASKDTTWDQVIHKFEMQAAIQALESLDAESRRLIIMRYVHGMSSYDMARTLNLKIGTSTSKVARALKKYRGLYYEKTKISHK